MLEHHPDLDTYLPIVGMQMEGRSHIPMRDLSLIYFDLH